MVWVLVTTGVVLRRKWLYEMVTWPWEMVMLPWNVCKWLQDRIMLTVWRLGSGAVERGVEKWEKGRDLLLEGLWKSVGKFLDNFGLKFGVWKRFQRAIFRNYFLDKIFVALIIFWSVSKRTTWRVILVVWCFLWFILSPRMQTAKHTKNIDFLDKLQ